MKAEPAATPVEIEAAPARIADAIRPTPQIAPATLSDLAGASVHLKHEHMRATGGVTLRGAGDAILQPDAGGRTRGDLVVPDRLGRTPVMGKFGSAGPADAGASLAEPVAAAGKTPRRRAADEITIADLTGAGVQDTVIASFARKRAGAAGAGVVFTT